MEKHVLREKIKPTDLSLNRGFAELIKPMTCVLSSKQAKSDGEKVQGNKKT